MLIDVILVYVAASLVATIAARQVGLSPIAGYLLVGVAMGPDALGWVQDGEGMQHIAEIGVLFLMFTIGLEFSLPRLIADRSLVLGMGGLQVIISVVVFALAGWMLGLAPVTATAVGAALAMSSTAIASRQLLERGELNTGLGHAAIGVLLFQDLATVFVLLLLPILSTASAMSMASEAGWVLLRGALVFGALLFVGRWVIRPAFRKVALLHSPEIFMLAVILASLGAASIAQAAGLSPALGAFLAGMVLGETEFRHQVESDIRPFQDVLLGLFFVAVGSLLDLDVVFGDWLVVLAVTVGLILTKAVVVGLIAWLRGTGRVAALRLGFVLAQAGEFSLVLLYLMRDLEILEGRSHQIVLSAVVLSMMAASVLIRWNARWASGIAGGGSVEGLDDVPVGTVLDDHVIVCGYGRIGQNVVRLLEEQNMNYVCMDLDPDRVRAALTAGERVMYGDATHRGILEACGLTRARALVITFDDHRAALKTLALTREERPDLNVLVRTGDDVHMEQLLEAGATEAVPDTLEASLTLGAQLLLLLGVSTEEVSERTDSIRADRYKLLRGVFYGKDRGASDSERLHVVRVPKGAYAAGKRLRDLGLDQLKVQVRSVRRHGIRGPDPTPDTTIRTEDVLVMRGPARDLSRAERRILSGGR